MRFRLVLSIWLVSTWCKFSISLFMTKWVRFKIFMVTKRRNTKFRPCKPKILILACCAKSYNLTSWTFKKCSFLPYVPRRTFQTLKKHDLKFSLYLRNRTINWRQRFPKIYQFSTRIIKQAIDHPYDCLCILLPTQGFASSSEVPGMR